SPAAVVAVTWAMWRRVRLLRREINIVPACDCTAGRANRPCHATRSSALVGLGEQAAVQLGGQGMDGPGDLGVGLQFQLLLDEVVVGLGLLECGLPVLADHDEGG